MNFGQNLYQWFLSNAQSLVLMAIVVIGIYLGFKREFSTDIPTSSTVTDVIVWSIEQSG
ncbi:hypothetical protein GPK80_13705, partial [Coprococcus comes]|nr:hypothetical protein [Coprococcus comes]